MKARSQHRHQEQLTKFDELPDSGLVPVTVVAGLLSLNKATCWSFAKDGKLPAPIKIGGATRWKVGDIRTILNGGKEAA